MDDEIWKPIEEFNGRYEVSNKGRIKFTEKGKLIKLHDNGGGYLMYPFYCPILGKSKCRYAHRLVAQHFLDNPNNYPQVGHKDDDKSNNVVDNLYWCTGSRNIKDAHKTGRMKTRSEYGPISSYDSEVVIAAYTEVVIEGNGLTKTAKKYEMPRTTLSSIVNKRSRSDITDPIDKLLDNPQKLCSNTP